MSSSQALQGRGKGLRLPPRPGTSNQKEQAQKTFIASLLQENTSLKAGMKRLRKEKEEMEQKLMQYQEQNPSSPTIKLDTQTVMDFLINHGGLSRFTIMDDHWHARNPQAANQLFGFKTWNETKLRINEKFPDIRIEETPKIYRSKKNLIDMGEATDLEKCLCVKLMDRTSITAGRAALLFGRDKRTIVKWKERWCPRWGIERKGTGEDSAAARKASKNSNKRQRAEPPAPADPTDLVNILAGPSFQPRMMAMPPPKFPNDFGFSGPSRRNYGP